MGDDIGADVKAAIVERQVDGTNGADSAPSDEGLVMEISRGPKQVRVGEDYCTGGP
ncbi:hypothetical protein JW868_03745 [Candidatus Woesearchaeota archaeon]|nr:hypothetical protein [Candidatus Woesearchaeota archaeon]